MSNSPVALTIAGSDSGGGAGIQGDLKTFEALEVFGTSAITAVTAQNTLGINVIHDIPAAVVKGQIEAVVSDLTPDAVKIGMLTTVPVIRAVANALRALGRPVVVDPILVSTSGFRVLRGTSIHALVNDLLPLATLVTPNLPEAATLVGFPVETEADAKAAARRIQEMGAKAVLLKGGHGTGETVTDLLLDGRTWFRFVHPRIDSRSTHGTGCALSAAVTAWLARGEPLNDAVERAIAFVTRAIERAPGLGAGQGPLGHRRASAP